MNTKEVMMTIIGLAKVREQAIEFDGGEIGLIFKMYASVFIHGTCVEWILLMIRPTPAVPSHS